METVRKQSRKQVRNMMKLIKRKTKLTLKPIPESPRLNILLSILIDFITQKLIPLHTTALSSCYPTCTCNVRNIRNTTQTLISRLHTHHHIHYLTSKPNQLYCYQSRIRKCTCMIHSVIWSISLPLDRTWKTQAIINLKINFRSS